MVGAKRLVLAAACTGLWLSGAADAEDSGKPRGPGIDEGIREWSNQGKPVSGALQLLAQMNAELRTGGRTDLLPVRSMLFEEACYRANGEELRSLGAMIPDLAPGADGTPNDCERFNKCIIFYGNAAFRHEVSKLAARPAHLKLPTSTAAPPAELTIAPKTLRDAWLARAAVMEPFERLKEAAISEPAATKEMPETRADIAVLKKLGPSPPRGLWRELLWQAHREQLQPMPGDREVSRRALHFGLVLSLLADGRMDAAVGAVCSRLFDEEGYSNDPARQTYAAVTRHFLGAHGLDWEFIFLGLLLQERPVKPGEFRVALANTEAWLMLGAFGSPRGVQAGLDWISFAKMGTEEARPFLIQALGPDPVPSKVLVDSRPKRAKVLPPEIRAQATPLFAGFLDPTQQLTPLHRALEDVSAWMAKDFETPLRKLLEHRSRVIAARALWLLKSAGLVAEETTLPPGPGPIRVRLMVDGVPLANTPVAVQTRGHSWRMATSAEGEVVLSTDGVLIRETIDSIQISGNPDQLVAPAARLPQAIAEILRSKPDPIPEQKPANAGENPPKPWFQVTVPVNPEGKTPKEVTIETGELEVGLKGGPGIPNDTPISVFLMRDGRVPLPSIQLPGKPWQSVVFQNVQVGKYRLVVQGAGLAQPQFLDAHVTKRGSLKLVELAAGRTVHGTLAGGAPNLRLTSVARLTRDGVEVRTALYARGDRWDGLPLGKYRLRIPSTKELEAAAQKRGIVRPPTWQQPRHAAYEMDFDVTAESPAIVELGVIQLKPEEVGN